jgi:hypothetical protein
MANEAYLSAVEKRIGAGGFCDFAEEIARDAYAIADAMLAERERTKGSKVDKELQE